jgi:hypothetical protein
VTFRAYITDSRDEYGLGMPAYLGRYPRKEPNAMAHTPSNAPTVPRYIDIRVAYKMLDALETVLDTDGWHLAPSTEKEVEEAILASGLRGTRSAIATGESNG